MQFRRNDASHFDCATVACLARWQSKRRELIINCCCAKLTRVKVCSPEVSSVIWAAKTVAGRRNSDCFYQINLFAWNIGKLRSPKETYVHTCFGFYRTSSVSTMLWSFHKLTMVNEIVFPFSFREFSFSSNKSYYRTKPHIRKEEPAYISELEADIFCCCFFQSTSWNPK